MASQVSILDDSLQARLADLRANIDRVFLGKPEVVTQVLVGLMSRGHLLIEDVPGVGKTVLARALARSLDLTFHRIQLTPDMLPSDIIGVSVYDSTSGTFEFKKGPIFANVILADEINRTTPRTQSALLEAMNECQVSVDGRTLVLEKPFWVIATQNPFEFEGTYYLPENQLDRFALRIRIGYPDRAVEKRIVREEPATVGLETIAPVMSRADVLAVQAQVPLVRVDDRLTDYALALVEATRDHDQLEVGVSPRGTISFIRTAQALAMLSGRDYVIPDDLKAIFIPVCAHRVMSKSYMQDGHAVSTEHLLGSMLRHVPVPQ